MIVKYPTSNYDSLLITKKMKKLEERRAMRSSWYLDKLLSFSNSDTMFRKIDSTDPFTIDEFELVLTHDLYNASLCDYTSRLDKLEDVRLIDNQSKDYPIYEIDAPEGKYKIKFSYYNNHLGGW